MTTQSTASTTSLTRLQELLPQLFQATQLSGLPYLRFLLTEEISGLIALEQIQESLIVSAENVTGLPNMPRAVIGLLSSREQVFCVVNLPQVLGYTSMIGRQQNYRVIVVRVPRSGSQSNTESEVLLGLAVPQIQGVIRLSPEQLQAQGELIPENLKPFATGTSQLEGQPAYFLSADALAQAPTLYPAAV